MSRVLIYQFQAYLIESATYHEKIVNNQNVMLN